MSIIDLKKTEINAVRSGINDARGRLSGALQSIENYSSSKNSRIRLLLDTLSSLIYIPGTKDGESPIRDYRSYARNYKAASGNLNAKASSLKSTLTELDSVVSAIDSILDAIDDFEYQSMSLNLNKMANTGFNAGKDTGYDATVIAGGGAGAIDGEANELLTQTGDSVKNTLDMGTGIVKYGEYKSMLLDSDILGFYDENNIYHDAYDEEYLLQNGFRVSAFVTVDGTYMFKDFDDEDENSFKHISKEYGNFSDFYDAFGDLEFNEEDNRFSHMGMDDFKENFKTGIKDYEEDDEEFNNFFGTELDFKDAAVDMIGDAIASGKPSPELGSAFGVGTLATLAANAIDSKKDKVSETGTSSKGKDKLKDETTTGTPTAPQPQQPSNNGGGNNPPSNNGGGNQSHANTGGGGHHEQKTNTPPPKQDNKPTPKTQNPPTTQQKPEATSEPKPETKTPEPVVADSDNSGNKKPVVDLPKEVVVTPPSGPSKNGNGSLATNVNDSIPDKPDNKVAEAGLAAMTVGAGTVVGNSVGKPSVGGDVTALDMPSLAGSSGGSSGMNIPTATTSSTVAGGGMETIYSGTMDSASGTGMASVNSGMQNKGGKVYNNNTFADSLEQSTNKANAQMNASTNNVNDNDPNNANTKNTNSKLQSGTNGNTESKKDERTYGKSKNNSYGTSADDSDEEKKITKKHLDAPDEAEDNKDKNAKKELAVEEELIGGAQGYLTPTDEKVKVVATGVTVGGAILAAVLKLLHILNWLAFILLIIAIILLYTTYRYTHHKIIEKRKKQHLISIEKAKENESKVVEIQQLPTEEEVPVSTVETPIETTQVVTEEVNSNVDNTEVQTVAEEEQVQEQKDLIIPPMKDNPNYEEFGTGLDFVNNDENNTENQ